MTIQILTISTLYFIRTLSAAISELFHVFKLKANSAYEEQIFLYLFFILIH
jgi:hypothetical protein